MMLVQEAGIVPGSVRGNVVMELKGTDLCCVRGGRRVFAGVNFAVAVEEIR